MEPKLVSLQSVVDQLLKQGDAGKPWKNFNADMAKMTQYYAKVPILPETYWEGVVTEDAEVVSIETVQNGGTESGNTGIAHIHP